MRSLGVWELSAYEWTNNPCANGRFPTLGYTVAFNHLPLGSVVYIAGYGTYVVEDRCGINSRLDIYMGDVSTCRQFGIRYAEVFVYE